MVHPYRDKTVSLATKHGKERSIAPALRTNPGLQVQLARIDTDTLGTFTGEIERPGTPRETALVKARLGVEQTGIPRGLASEGSFGPHPAAFLVPAGHEMLAFIDLDLGIEVIEQRLCPRTNFAHCTARHAAELGDFLNQARFPTHALIARPNAVAKEPLTKGLTTYAELDGAIRRAARASTDGLALVETDMRAHHNPTRLREIAFLAEQLAQRLTSRCPACDSPGWGIVGVVPGLPCSWCDQPTQLASLETRGCPACPNEQRISRSDGLQTADPGNCDYCNP